MVKKIGLYLVAAFALLLLVECAQINPLVGGPDDDYSPAIDSSGTFPLNGQINFGGNEVVIKFNEYIVLNNPKENIIITPQFNIPADVDAKNKKLTISFNEPLTENTTYTISFNHAVQDITEKNDSVFQYVFSTGNYIDSLSISGRVTDAFTNQPGEGYLVGLYRVETEVQFDSIPIKDRPIYIAQSNKSGQFKMNYLKAGEYFIFAIQDQNKNLKLDGTERRSFLMSERIRVGEENEIIELQSFKPETGEAKVTTVKFDYPGRLEFILSNEPDSFAVNAAMELIQENTERKDSLVYWLSKSPEKGMSFVVSVNEKPDTIKPLYKGLPTGKEVTVLNFTDNLQVGKLLPNQLLEITVSEPVDSIYSTGIHFMTADSVEVEAVDFDVQNVRTIRFDSLSPTIALLKIDSGAVVSCFKHVNAKPYWASLKVLEPDYFGTLILNIDTVFQQAVFVDLLDEKNKVISSVPFSNQLIFNEIIPGKYQVRIIFDDNGDGKWTTGSLIEKRNPEKVIYNKELIDVKSNWEKEVDWVIQN